MAINKDTVAQILSGLPTQEEMISGTDFDNLNASVEDPATGTEEPARLREGEYVIDIPSIIALGEGDYESGLTKLTEIHQALREKGKSLMETLGLGGIEGT